MKLAKEMDMGKQESRTIVDTLGLPADLLNKMFDLIGQNFRRMPKLV